MPQTNNQTTIKLPVIQWKVSKVLGTICTYKLQLTTTSRGDYNQSSETV